MLPGLTGYSGTGSHSGAAETLGPGEPKAMPKATLSLPAVGLFNLWFIQIHAAHPNQPFVGAQQGLDNLLFFRFTEVKTGHTI